MSERANKTSICTVVFLDIVDYSEMSVSDQSDIKEQFNALINEAIKDVAQNDRIILDTGDGAAISLLGAPEDGLFVSMTIRDGILKYNKQSAQQLFVRIGINLGPVRIMNDINGQPNIVGDGINVAQRVMSFAEPNQILVSRTYYEVTSRLTEEIAGMFTYFGIKLDKHVREHEVYVIRPTSDGLASAASTASMRQAIDDENQAAEDWPFSKKGWYLLAMLLLGLVSFAFYWSTNMAVPKPVLPKATAEMPASSSPAATPAGPSKAADPIAWQPLPSKPSSVDMNPPAEPDSKPAESTPAKSSEVKGSKMAKPGEISSPHTNSTLTPADTSHATTQNKAPHKIEQEEASPEMEPAEISRWDSFKESVKEGGKGQCSQGEKALGQCR